MRSRLKGRLKGRMKGNGTMREMGALIRCLTENGLIRVCMHCSCTEIFLKKKKMPAQEDQVVADNEDAMVEEDEGVRIDRRALRHALPLLFQRHALTHGRAHIGVVDRPTSPMWTSCKRWASTRPT